MDEGFDGAMAGEALGAAVLVNRILFPLVRGFTRKDGSPMVPTSAQVPLVFAVAVVLGVAYGAATGKPLVHAASAAMNGVAVAMGFYSATKKRDE
jgi:hypothetical protein